jgi:NAD(P)-dependent dehydrogenase (short-subunit alcohol dehydrogenase family)
VGKKRVCVNALVPGYVATVRERPELFNMWLDMTPMGRPVEASKIASAVVYLASAASSLFWRHSVDRRRLYSLVKFRLARIECGRSVSRATWGIK